ncbi:DUF6069 family protein [Cellulosimicrobium funkei]|uniref:DUF6069 family protein n=1 Tax=Cellulosimicrobium funkei TaxID=264251 RepID=UPI0034472295
MSTTRSTPSSTSHGAAHVPGHPRASVPDGRTARRVPRWVVPPVAAVVAAVVLLVGTALGVDPAVRTATGTQTVGVVAAVVVTLVVGYLGWGVRALLGRLRSGSRRAWFVTCGVILLVSLLGPLGAVTPGAVALLVVEHLTVGATLTLGLRR